MFDRKPGLKGGAKAKLAIVILIVLAGNLLVIFFFMGGGVDLGNGGPGEVDLGDGGPGEEPPVSSSRFPEEINGFTLQGVKETTGEECHCFGIAKGYPAEKKYEMAYRKGDYKIDVTVTLLENTSDAEECFRTTASKNGFYKVGEGEFGGEELTYGHVNRTSDILLVNILTGKGYSVKASDIRRNVKETVATYEGVKVIGEELVRRADL